MNTTAIHHAVRLKKHPEEMAWLRYPDSDLPDGITDLLRIYSAKDQQSAFAKTNNIDEKQLSESLFNFIDKVIVNNNNSDAKILGTDEFAKLQLQHFHFELLQGVYDDSEDQESKEKIQLINDAYQRLEAIKRQKDGVISFSEQRKTLQSQPQENQSSALQSSSFKTIAAVLSSISIFALVAMAGKFNEPTTGSISVETSAEARDISTDAQAVLVAANPSANKASPNISLINNSKHTLQRLVKKLEMAYETGNVEAIAPILANSLDDQNQDQQQVSAKLNTLFEISAERKTMLYDFKWNNVANSLQGQGKFLSRYQLVGEKDLLTRSGNALISAQIIDSKLTITQLALENPID